MTFIYGTKNKSKLDHMVHLLRGLNIELEALGDVTEPEESGETVAENAEIKAMHYFKQLHQPVFSCDSGLYFDNVAPEDQPGKFIRRINGKYLNDDEMIHYYSQLAEKYGGELIARYRNAICLVLNPSKVILYDGDDLNSEPFKIVSKPHAVRKEGFPLDSLSVDIKSGEYYFDRQNFISEEDTLEKGFRDFFKRVLSPEVTVRFQGYDAISIQLYPYHAPETTKNFIELIQSGYYNDKSICRVVPNRLIQSGDDKLPPEAWTDDTPGYILNGEFNREGFENPLTFNRGTVGMAMAAYEFTNYATAGSFFIMTKDEKKLDDIVPAFGRVIHGMDVVDAINGVNTHTRFGYDAPETTIAIEHISVDTKGVVYEAPEKVDMNVLKCCHN